MKGIVFISYGMGGAAVEWWQTGLRRLVTRCKSIGLDTMGSPYNWADVNAIVSEIKQAPNVPIAVGGASLGDNEAPDIAGRTKRHIAYLFGFQCSMYGVKVGVPSNVGAADNIYNPNWWETFGLGSRQWTLAPGNKTTLLRNIPISQPHPDDWGIAQDIVYSRIHHLMLPGTNEIRP